MKKIFRNSDFRFQILSFLILIVNCQLLIVNSFAQNSPYSKNWRVYSSNGAACMLEQNDVLWIGGNGLTRYNKKDGSKKLYNKFNNGFLIGGVNDIAQDKKGNLYLAIGNGLIKFDRKTLEKK